MRCELEGIGLKGWRVGGTGRVRRRVNVYAGRRGSQLVAVGISALCFVGPFVNLEWAQAGSSVRVERSQMEKMVISAYRKKVQDASDSELVKMLEGLIVEESPKVAPRGTPFGGFNGSSGEQEKSNESEQAKSEVGRERLPVPVPVIPSVPVPQPPPEPAPEPLQQMEAEASREDPAQNILVFGKEMAQGLRSRVKQGVDKIGDGLTGIKQNIPTLEVSLPQPNDPTKRLIVITISIGVGLILIAFITRFLTTSEEPSDSMDDSEYPDEDQQSGPLWRRDDSVSAIPSEDDSPSFQVEWDNYQPSTEYTNLSQDPWKDVKSFKPPRPQKRSKPSTLQPLLPPPSKPEPERSEETLWNNVDQKSVLPLEVLLQRLDRRVRQL